jgi:DNA sulfur modification protein DndE
LKLRKSTGIENWNVICRWGFCQAIKEEIKLPKSLPKRDVSNIEMTWKTFAGEGEPIYQLLLTDLLHSSEQAEAKRPDQVLRFIVERGLESLLSKDISEIEDLVGLAC